MAAVTGSCGLAAFQKTVQVLTTSLHPQSRKIPRQSLPPPPKQRRTESLTETPFDLGSGNSIAAGQLDGTSYQHDTVLYLAYGSNLSAETFQGRRNIRPLSAVNVVVPELVMTFDLAGLPYVEPCFANTRYRGAPSVSLLSEKQDLLSDPPDKYHKNRWKKGLVGVVYEVTKEDYAHIIATEGGGASYQDVLADCYELHPNEDIVPDRPASTPFKAHTLYSPASIPGDNPGNQRGHFSRPDPSYAQASHRYLKLIMDGADEHALPAEYKAYLHHLRPYTITTQGQRIGAWIFGMIWLPFISLILGLYSRFAGKDGKAPSWLITLSGAVFKSMWVSYDCFFYEIFGDGERTVDKDEGKIATGQPSLDDVKITKVNYHDV